MMSLKEMTEAFEYMRNDNPLNKVGFLFKLKGVSNKLCITCRLFDTPLF